MSSIGRVGIVWVIICLLIGVGSETSMAQADDVPWSEPVNLSRSGAAEAPVLVVSPQNQKQVFWWDRFDGIMTAYTAGGRSWSSPEVSPLQIIETLGEGDRTQVVTTTIASMPQIIGVDDQVFALWLGTPAEETEAQPLLHSRLRIGTAAWSAPERLAESAIDWKMTLDARGILHLVYRQPQPLEESLAGVYYLHSSDEGVSWSTPVVLYSSAYARLWPSDAVHLSITADGLGNVFVGWDDPRQGRAFYARSSDNGVSWGQPGEVGGEDVLARRVRFVPLPAQSRSRTRSASIMLWELAGAASSCTLMQQDSEDGGRTWSEASRVLEDLASCPAEFSAVETDDSRVLAILDEGTERLLLAAWDGTQWSETKSLSFSFDDPDSGTTNYLEALEAHVTWDNALAVVGQGQDGEVWVLQGQIDVVDWTFAPPSPWSNLAIVAQSEVVPGFPSVATDAEGRVHIVWSAAPNADQPDTVLYYSRWDEISWSRPTVVLDAADGVSQEPALVFADGLLHAVWSSGTTGTVFYSKTYPQDAYAAGSWSTPLMLGAIDLGSSPAITVDLLGRLHVVYAVPLNEGRGIYYVRSDDNGESWSDAVQVFDAIAERWPGVNHPGVTVDEQGTVHAVWVRTPLPGYGVPQGVYYSQSTDHGKTWLEAVILTDGSYDWPRIVATLAGHIVVTWQDMANGVVQYRVSNDFGQTWGYVSQIAGLQAVEGRVTLAPDNAGSVHLAALVTETGEGIELLHLTFAEGQWSLLEPVDLSGMYLPVSGAVSAVSGELGLIDVVGVGNQLEDGGLLPNLWHTRRNIESRSEFQPAFAPEPTSTPTPGPAPIPSPTPRPAVDPNAPQTSAPVIELGPVSLPILALAGIGIAFLLVASVVTWKVTRR